MYNFMSKELMFSLLGLQLLLELGNPPVLVCFKTRRRSAPLFMVCTDASSVIRIRTTRLQARYLYQVPVPSVADRIRIRILLFSSVPFKTSTKFFCLLGYFLKVHLHHFSRIKSNKEITKQKKSMFFLIFFLMMEGSGSGSSKNILILRIRIRNTAGTKKP
jgi:hypothetical protein